MTDSQQPAAGWYPAPHANNEQRYWDGAQWLEPTPPAEEQTAQTPEATAEQPKKSRKKGWIIAGSVVAGVLVIGGIGNAIGGGNDDNAQAEPKTTAPATAEPVVEEEEPVVVTVPDVIGLPVTDAIATLADAGLTPPALSTFEDPAALVTATSRDAGSEATEGAQITIEVAEKPKLTVGQQNALDKAQSYLNYSGFSRSGLIEQLEYEGYSTEDATFGADNAGADWNAEAAEKAESYMEYSSFSREGLYDQLQYEGFTPEQIEFALGAVGY